jgi:hypothetical protein
MTLRDDSALIRRLSPSHKVARRGTDTDLPPPSDLKGEQLWAPATTFLKR